MREPATRFGIAYMSTFTNGLPSRYVSGDKPIDDDHRPLVQRALHRRRAGRRDRHVRGRDHVVRRRAPALPRRTTAARTIASAIVAAQATVNCTPARARESAASRPRTSAQCARLRCGGCPGSRRSSARPAPARERRETPPAARGAPDRPADDRRSGRRPRVLARSAPRTER